MVKRKYILYIEDEIELSEIVKEELESECYKVVTSETYTDAIKKLSNQKFDLIIADLQLKKGSGDMVIELIKQDSKNFNYSTPVFVASGMITSDILKRVGSHIDHAFVKPFEIDELLDKVKKFIA